MYTPRAQQREQRRQRVKQSGRPRSPAADARIRWYFGTATGMVRPRRDWVSYIVPYMHKSSKQEGSIQQGMQLHRFDHELTPSSVIDHHAPSGRNRVEDPMSVLLSESKDHIHHCTCRVMGGCVCGMCVVGAEGGGSASGFVRACHLCAAFVPSVIPLGTRRETSDMKKARVCTAAHLRGLGANQNVLRQGAGRSCTRPIQPCRH